MCSLPILRCLARYFAPAHPVSATWDYRQSTTFAQLLCEFQGSELLRLAWQVLNFLPAPLVDIYRIYTLNSKEKFELGAVRDRWVLIHCPVHLKQIKIISLVTFQGAFWNLHLPATWLMVSMKALKATFIKFGDYKDEMDRPWIYYDNLIQCLKSDRLNPDWIMLLCVVLLI